RQGPGRPGMTGADGPALAATERRLRDAFTAAGQTVAPGSIRSLPRPLDRPDARDRLAGRRAPARPVRAPRLREQVLVPLAVATLGSDRTFVAAASWEAGAARCSTWFYRFSLGSGGRPENLARLSSWAVPGVVTDSSALAASANGQVVAYATQDCTTQVPAVR